MSHPPKKRTAATLKLIDRLRAICMAMPGAVEKEAWGEPTWRAGAGKMFAMCDTYHHGSPHLSVHLPAPPGAQEALVDADPARFFRPPYTGSKGWIAVILDTGPDWEMVASLVRTAYEQVAPAARGSDMPTKKMRTKKPETIDEYLAAQPPAARRVLRRVRTVLRKALPDAVEVISYSIPAFRLEKRIVLYFAGWKDHFSLYPVGKAMIEAFGDDLDGYELSHKGTIRFDYDARLPVHVLARIAKFRAAELKKSKMKTKTRAKKK